MAYRPPQNPYPYDSAYPYAPAPHQAPLTGQAKVNADLTELQRRFPEVEREVIESVYQNVGGHMDKTFQALKEMSAPARLRDDSSSISPQTKLNFLMVVFDKLNPNFIHHILEKYRWSVEAALDDLLTAEDQRSKQEEEQRRKEEMLRRQREEEERQRLRQAQIELEHKNSALLLQQMFPRMPQQLIHDTLQRSNWDQRVAVEALLPLEQMRAEQELREIRHREEQERLRRQEEEKRIRQEAERLHADQLEAMLREVRSWDELAQRLAGNASQAELERERAAMVEAARAVAINLTEPELRAIFEEVGWDKTKALAKVDERSITKFRQKLQQTFPSLPADAIDHAVRFYPDESAAIAHLRPLAEKKDSISLLREALDAARARLENVQKRHDEFDKHVADVKANWARRAEELTKLSGAEKLLMQTAQEMLQQKESAQIAEQKKKLAEELELRTKEFLDLQDQLTKAMAESATITAPPVSLASAPLQMQSHAERVRLVEKKLQEHERAKQEELEARKSIVADKVRQQFGEERFAQLQEAIGRAPGGVAKGFYREDFTTRSDREKTEAILAATQSKNPQSPPSATASKSPISTGATSHVSELANKLGDLKLTSTSKSKPATPITPSTPSQYPPGSPLSTSNLPSAPSHSQYPPGYPPSSHNPSSSALSASTPPIPPSSPSPYTSSLPTTSTPSTSSPTSFSTSNSPSSISSSQLAASAMASTQPALFGLPPTASSAPNPSHSTPASTSSFPFSSPAEEQYYSQLFAVADASRTGTQIDMKDAQFFRRSGLSDSDLAHVWAIASKGANRLTKDQFFVALRLIALLQSKRPLDLQLISTPGLPFPVFHGIPVPHNPSAAPTHYPAPTSYPSGMSSSSMGLPPSSNSMGSIPVGVPITHSGMPPYYAPASAPNPNSNPMSHHMSGSHGYPPMNYNPNPSMGYYPGYPPNTPM